MKEKLAKHKKLWIFLIIVCVLVCAGAALVNRAKKQAAELMAQMNQQETAFVESRNLVESVSATGKITSVGSRTVTAAVSGIKVTEVQVEVGDMVEEGQELVLLDSTDIQADLADAKASLSASNSKMEIDLNAAERSLAEAQESRNIDAERASVDVADAWNDYLKALTDLEEAENDYKEAQQTTIEKNGELELRKQLIEDADVSTYTGLSSSTYAQYFNQAKSELSGYLQGKNNSWDATSLFVEMDLSSISGDYIISAGGGDPDISAAEINSWLAALQQHQANYASAKAAEAVAAGQQADYQTLQSELSEWQQKYSTAKSTEEQLKTIYENAQTAAENKLDAYHQKVRSQEDTTRNDNSTVSNREDSLATSKISQSTTGLSDKKSIRNYEKQLKECTVTAPISGVVTAVSVEEGDTYAGGTILTIEDESSYEVSTEIDEYDINKIELGQKVVIKTNGTGDTELAGTVIEIAPRATGGTTGSTVTYNVKISVDTKNEDLRLDMTAKLSIILEEKNHVLSVPYDAVQEDHDGYYVEVVKEPSQTAEGTESDQSSATEGEASETEASTQSEKIYVQKGIESDYYIEISGEGISEGVEVIVPKKDSGTSLEELMFGGGAMGGF